MNIYIVSKKRNKHLIEITDLATFEPSEETPNYVSPLPARVIGTAVSVTCTQAVYNQIKGKESTLEAPKFVQGVDDPEIDPNRLNVYVQNDSLKVI